MIVESQPTHSNFDDPISAKFHTRFSSIDLADALMEKAPILSWVPRWIGSRMDDMIRQILFIFRNGKKPHGKHWLPCSLKANSPPVLNNTWTPIALLLLHNFGRQGRQGIDDEADTAWIQRDDRHGFAGGDVCGNMAGLKQSSDGRCAGCSCRERQAGFFEPDRSLADDPCADGDFDAIGQGGARPG